MSWKISKKKIDLFFYEQYACLKNINLFSPKTDLCFSFKHATRSSIPNFFYTLFFIRHSIGCDQYMISIVNRKRRRKTYITFKVLFRLSIKCFSLIFYPFYIYQPSFNFYYFPLVGSRYLSLLKIDVRDLLAMSLSMWNMRVFFNLTQYFRYTLYLKIHCSFLNHNVLVKSYISYFGPLIL